MYSECIRFQILGVATVQN